MLVAKREPSFHSGAQDVSPVAGIPAGVASPAPLTRIMTLLQIAGSVLAIPVGVASGYSIYRANFSPEITCQTMRANLIGTLDKNLDAATLRMLVRHDVETFELSCAAVDPDATAAFKRLLQSDRSAPAEAKAATAPVLSRAAPEPQAEASRAAVASKPAPPAKSVESAKPAKAVGIASHGRQAVPQVDAPAAEPSPDDTWVAAVRHALTLHAPDTVPAEEPAPADAAVSTAGTREIQRQSAPVLATPAPAGITSPQRQFVPPATPPAAPAAPAVEREHDHPVPPAPILGTTAGLGPHSISRPEAQNDSRFGSWVAQVPVVGRLLGGSDVRPR